MRRSSALARPPLLVALAACAAAAAWAEQQPREAEGNGTCTATDMSERCIAEATARAHSTGFPMSLLWPPSRDTLPNLALLTLAAWSVVAVAMRSQENDAEREYQKKRALQVLAQLSQTDYEHAEGTQKWKKYRERQAALREVAKQRLAKEREDDPKCNETEEEFYQMVIVETGFASEDPPEAALDPRRVFEVLIDEVEDCKVVDIRHIESRLGPEKFKDLQGYFEAVRKILLERLLDRLGQLCSKTRAGYENGKDPRYKPYASGTQLQGRVELALKMKKHFYPRHLFGLVDSRAPEGDEMGKAVLAKLKEARALMRDIKKNQPWRVVQILGFFEVQTFAYLGLASLTRIFGGAIGPLRTFLFNLVVVNAQQEEWRQPVFYNLLCIGVVFFLDWFVNDWVSMVSQTKATSLMKHALRTQLFAAVLRQDAEYFQLHDGGEICDRVQHDVNRVADHAIYIPMDIVGILSSMIWHIMLMRAYCPGMLVRTLITSTCIAPIFMLLNRLIDKLRKKDDRTMRRLNATTSEMLHKVNAVREFSREKQEAAELDRAAHVMTWSMIKLHIMNHMQGMTIFTLLFAGEMSNYWYGAGLVNRRELDPVTLIQVGHLVYHITFMMKHLMEQVPRFMDIMIPASRIFELLESKSLIEPMPGDELPPFVKKNGGIELEFRDVSFAYPLMPEVTVLRHCSLTIPAGRTVAICGERAAGKSTIYCLIQRMYDVEYGRGEVVVNDKPIQYWDVRSYRRNISILAQKGLLFKGTIKENILYGLNDGEKRARGFHTLEGDAELQRLLEISGAWDIVKEFPLKMEQRIGTGGVNLSGGTEQCVFIARGLVKEPAMMLLDEATSAMDTRTQKRAASGIRAEQSRLGFSVVQVAHRIETLTGSDVLYFVDHGRVVESGGLSTLNGTAIEELVAKEIEFKQTVNAETGEQQEQQSSGFYRLLHEAYYDLDFHSMGISQLLKKVRSLEEQLTRAKLEKDSKLQPLLAKLSSPSSALNLERAQTDPPTPVAAALASQNKHFQTGASPPILENAAQSAPPLLSMERCYTTPTGCHGSDSKLP